jgi:hypothetical protein
MGLPKLDSGQKWSIRMADWWSGAQLKGLTILRKLRRSIKEEEEEGNK